MQNLFPSLVQGSVLVVVIIYYFQIWNKKERWVIISRVISSHVGPMYIETPYISSHMCPMYIETPYIKWVRTPVALLRSFSDLYPWERYEPPY